MTAVEDVWTEGADDDDDDDGRTGVGHREWTSGDDVYVAAVRW